MVVVVVATRERDNMEKINDDCADSLPRYLKEWDIEVGPLPTLVIQNKSESHEPDVVVVFLHGYGSNTRRTKKIAETVLNHCFLPPVSRFLKQQEHTFIPTVRFLIPQAPHKVSHGVFSWWKLPNIGLFASLLMSGTHELESYAPRYDLRQARLLMRDYLEAVQTAHPNALLVFGGFSQGSLLVIDVLLTRSYIRKPDMVILMSSTLIDKQEWMEQLKQRQPLFDTYIIQVHGRHDQVLAFNEAKKLFIIISDNNSMRTEFYPFDGGHDMSMKARKYVACALQTFLYNRLG